jgi:hypothetical protein
VTTEAQNEVLEPVPAPRDNGMTPERLAALPALIHQQNRDPDYKERLEKERLAAEEYRRQVNEEAIRQLDAEEGK